VGCDDVGRCIGGLTVGLNYGRLFHSSTPLRGVDAWAARMFFTGFTGRPFYFLDFFSVGSLPDT